MDGSVRTWVGTLSEDLEPGGDFLIDLTMTTLHDSPVMIEYTVMVTPGNTPVFADGFETGDTAAWSAP